MTGPDLTLVVLLACGASGKSPNPEAVRPCPFEEVLGTADGSVAEATGDATRIQAVSEEAKPAAPKPKEVFYSVLIGAGFNENYPDGEFFRFSAWKPGRQGVTLDIGEQHSDGESSLGAGATYWRNLDPKTSVSLSAGGGTGAFAPRAWVGGSVSHPFFDIGLTAGASYKDWRNGDYTTDVGLGAQRWFPHWIVGGGATYSQGQPASFMGWRGNVGLTYYAWRKTYVSVGVDFGNVRQREWRYDTRSKGINVGFSQWFSGNSSVNISAGRGFDNDIYGFSVSYYREW